MCCFVMSDQGGEDGQAEEGAQGQAQQPRRVHHQQYRNGELHDAVEQMEP